VKKLISIGVALALLTMAVVPAVTAAQCDYDGIEPDTYAKIPFAILESGFHMVGQFLGGFSLSGHHWWMGWRSSFLDSGYAWMGLKFGGRYTYLTWSYIGASRLFG
jgi:hypothetical protein